MNLIDKDLLLTKLIKLELKDPNFVMEQVKGVVVDMIVIEECKHGHWISLEPEIGLYSCSECEHKILRAKCNYCPCCGAIMDEEVEK